MASPHAVITGVPGDWTRSTPPPRMEVNELIKDRRMWSLYVQAIQAMSVASQGDPISHFQIGGIHGLPFIQWQDSGGDSPVSGSRWGGYCTHGSVLFPTWHRPYVTLYEQTMQAHAVEIAKNYTVDQTEWQNAALNLRAPYWDWAANAIPPDEVIQDNQLTIIGFDGNDKQIDNPLLGYRFHPVSDGQFPTPYSRWQSTLRYPSSTQANAHSQPNRLVNTLRADADNIRESVYNMLTRIRTWPAFSNHTAGDGGSSATSLEGIHDGIHVDVGGRNGHMSDPAVAGLDPIFFMHHANVDRLVALWQAVNPNTWVSQGPANGGTWTISSNAMEDATTDLTPFWNGASSYWGSTACRAWFMALGYTYPEFVGLDMNDQQAVRQAIGRQINELYGDPSRETWSFAAANSGAVKEAAPALMATTEKIQPAPMAAQKLFAAPAPAPTAGPSSGAGSAEMDVDVEGLDDTHRYYDWTARIHCKKYEVGGSFRVVIFLGPVPENAEDWVTSPNYVGSYSAFVNSALESCENCRTRQEQVIEGFIPLNRAVARRSGLKSFDPKNIEPYLKENLHWRVEQGGEEVDMGRLPSLQVVVVATPLGFHTGEVFPAMGRARHFHSITEGRRGGHQPHVAAAEQD